jgi:drug/metabolite transporter (DMT)-like permease
MGIIFAVLAALSQSILWVSLKKSYENLAPSIAFFFDMIMGVLVWIPFSLLIGVDFTHMGEILFYAVISGVLSEAFVFYVFSKGEVSYTSTIFSTYPLFTIFFSVLLNHESLLPIQWGLVGLVILGTLLVSMPVKISKKEFAKKSFLIWPLLGALAVGISDTLSKGIIDKTSAESFLFGLALAQIPVAFGYLKYEKQTMPKLVNIRTSWDTYKYAVLGSIMSVFSVLFLWLAFERAPASIASPITASSPGFVILLAITFLKEKVAKKDFVGFVLIVASVMGISYFS